MTVEEWAKIYKATIKEGLRCDDDIAQSAYEVDQGILIMKRTLKKLLMKI